MVPVNLTIQFLKDLSKIKENILSAFTEYKEILTRFKNQAESFKNNIEFPDFQNFQDLEDLVDLAEKMKQLDDIPQEWARCSDPEEYFLNVRTLVDLELKATDTLSCFSHVWNEDIAELDIEQWIDNGIKNAEFWDNRQLKEYSLMFQQTRKYATNKYISELQLLDVDDADIDLFDSDELSSKIKQIDELFSQASKTKKIRNTELKRIKLDRRSLGLGHLMNTLTAEYEKSISSFVKAVRVFSEQIGIIPADTKDFYNE